MPEQCWECGCDLVPGQAVRKTVRPRSVDVAGYGASHTEQVRICLACANREAAQASAQQQAESRKELGCWVGYVAILFFLILGFIILYWIDRHPNK